MTKEVEVEIVRDKGASLWGTHYAKGDRLSVKPDVAKSLERHTIAKRVKTIPKKPGSAASSRKTRTVDPSDDRAEE
jgi:hypothetical protein